MAAEAYCPASLEYGSHTWRRPSLTVGSWCRTTWCWMRCWMLCSTQTSTTAQGWVRASALRRAALACAVVAGRQPAGARASGRAPTSALFLLSTSPPALAPPAVIDGFPRTALQVDFVKLLYDKLLALHLKHADGPDEWRFPRPSFKASTAGVRAPEPERLCVCSCLQRSCSLASWRCAYLYPRSRRPCIQHEFNPQPSCSLLTPGGDPVCGRGGERAAADEARADGEPAQQARAGGGGG